MHEVLVNRLGGLSLPRKSVVRLTDRPDMTLDVYRGRKTTIQQHTTILIIKCIFFILSFSVATDAFLCWQRLSGQKIANNIMHNGGMGVKIKPMEA